MRNTWRSSKRRAIAALTLCATVAAVACRSDPKQEPGVALQRASILLITLDTTRADAIGPEAKDVDTPSFNELAKRGMRFRHAYATVPETLPSHSSLFTGLYPGGHGVHENARTLSSQHAVATEKLKAAGYRTAAFVSAFVLAGRFGLSRGFDLYDDQLTAGRTERPARETTDRALAFLSDSGDRPVFLWVHYFEPHAPYAPPEPFASRYARTPYLGEVAAMDEQLGRLVRAFEQSVKGPHAIIAVADHGEALGDHGELQHGNLLYQPTMLVPLVVAGPDVSASISDQPVSTRRVFHTLLDFAGIASNDSLRRSSSEVVLGEAMKPYLSYGWQPQIMAVGANQKAIFAGTTEIYDIESDPGETRNLGSGANLPARLRKALDDYPVPALDAVMGPENLSEEARRNLASLGYVSASATPVVRKDAPRPVDMVRLFPLLERASALFVEERYADVIPLLQNILKDDRHNLDAALRLATAYSSLGRNGDALAAFRTAAAIAPKSPDVRVYLALHHARGPNWREAVPMLEQIATEMPDRLPVTEALARLKARIGMEAMAAGQTGPAIEAFERARQLNPKGFPNDLELGVLYLAARRFEDARAALDRVPSTHPAYPMALFKRAQVSVLLNEPDASARIQRARESADATTRPLIARERLFAGR